MKVYDGIANYLTYNLDNTTFDEKQKSKFVLSIEHLYKALNDEKCQQQLIALTEKCIKETTDHYDNNEFLYSDLTLGKIIYDSYIETKDEKYKNTIELLKERLNSRPESEWSNFWRSDINRTDDGFDRLYSVWPFYMAYETTFHNKENYSDIVTKFVNDWDHLGKEFSLHTVSQYAMVLIDMMDVMSEEIFEHYKTLEQLAKKSIKQLIEHINKENNLYYQAIDNGDIDEEMLSDLARTAYVIIKACNKRVLLKEKYLAAGMDVFDKVLQAVYDTGNETFKYTGKHLDVITVTAMAYAETLRQDS